MDLRAHFGAMWRRRWLIAVLALAAAGAAYVLTSLEPKVYQAQAELSVTPASLTSSGQTATSDAATFLSATYAQLGATRPVLSQAASRSRLAINEATAADRLTVGASAAAGFLTVTSKGPSPSAAEALGNGLISALVQTVQAQQAQSLQAELAPVEDQIRSVSAQLQRPGLPSAQITALQAEYSALLTAATDRQLQPIDQLTLVSPPRSGSVPVFPQPKRNAALAFVTALILAAEGAAGLEAVSDRFPSDALDEEITRVTGVPVLAHIPSGEGDDTVEAIRTLRTNLLFMNEAGQIRSVAIASADPAAGKSFVALHLAASMAELGVPAALVDGDMRRPVLHQRTGLARSPGLGEILGGADLAGCSRIHPDHQNLLVVAAGAPVPDPAGALSRHLVRRVLDRLDQARLVVVDTPAESVFPDAATIAANCDGTIVVIDASATRRRAARSMMARLRQVNARPVGVVVNRSSSAPRSTSYYSKRAREA